MQRPAYVVLLFGDTSPNLTCHDSSPRLFSPHPAFLDGRPLSWSPDSRIIQDLIGSSVGDGKVYENDEDCRDRADIRCATANGSATGDPRSIFQPLYEPGRRCLGAGWMVGCWMEGRRRKEGGRGAEETSRPSGTRLIFLFGCNTHSPEALTSSHPIISSHPLSTHRRILTTIHHQHPCSAFNPHPPPSTACPLFSVHTIQHHRT